MGRKYRTRSIANVLEEFKYIGSELPKVKEIFIEDDTFTINSKRVRQFCKELIGEKMDVTWSCNARANLDYQTMRLMKRAGCRLLDVGYESADDRILSNVKKGITVNQMKEFTNNARKAGLMILADFVIGLPGETKETIEKSMRFVMELRPELMQFSIACPIPGTEFYDWVRENGFLLTDNLGDLLDARGLQRAVISYPQLTNEDMERYAEVALKKYYLSISYIPVAAKCILRKRGLSELRRMSRSATRFITYLCGRSI